MSRAEAQMVTALPNNSDQIDRVIETLRGKADEDFDTFCAMLRDSSNGILADLLKREAQLRRRGSGRGTYTGEGKNPVLTVYCGLWCHLHALHYSDASFWYIRICHPFTATYQTIPLADSHTYYIRSSTGSCNFTFALPPLVVCVYFCRSRVGSVMCNECMS